MPTRAAFAVALAVSVAACGRDDGSSTPDAPADTAPATGEATDEATDADFPVSVDHRHGTTEIAAPPERVVTVGLTDHDPVLALGVQPVGVTPWATETELPPWSAAAVEGDGPALLPVEEIDFEQVASLQPDLVLAMSSALTAEQYDTLSQIAPTVAQPADHANYVAPWEEYTRLAGAALGLHDEAEQLIADTEATIAATRAAHPDLVGLAGVAGYDFGPDNVGVYVTGDTRTRILTSLGLEIPEEIDALAGDGDFHALLSIERLEMLEGVDVLMWCGSSQPFATTQEVYESLDLVAEGRDLYIDCTEPVGIAMSYGTVLSLPYAIDELAPQLDATADGDPATTP